MYLNPSSKATIYIVAIFVLPIILIFTGIIPLNYTGSILIAVSVLVLIFVLKEHWTLKDLGVRVDNFRKSFLPYLIFTIFGVAVLFILAKVFNKQPVENWWTRSHFIYFDFIFLSVMQEFLYRSYLMRKLKRINSSATFIIISNALLFALLHIIFPDPQIMLPIAFVGGLGFAFMYHKYSNLILISASHAVLNFFAVLLTFFTL